jgi:hypothetical protein
VKITVTPLPSGAAIVLGDVESGEIIVDPPLLPVERRAVQSEGLAFAATAWGKGRGNRSRSFSWTVLKEHADAGAAEGFTHTHAAEVPIDCSILITDGESSWSYSSAQIEEVACVGLSGRSTKYRYSVVNAIYQEPEPEPE